MVRSRMPAWLPAAAALAWWPISPATAADDALVFAPRGDWAVSSEAESCSLTRQFDNSGEPLQLRLQTFAPGGGFRAILLGKSLPQRDSGLLEFEYSFQPDPGMIEANGILNRSNGVPMVTFRTDLLPSATVELAAADRPATTPESTTARAAAIDTFTIRFSRGRPLTLQLGSMGEPIARLAACAQELPGKWGLDPAVQQTLSRRAVPLDQASWLGPGSYPWAYLRSSNSLMISLRMNVDERGAPTACVVQAPRTRTGAELLACREILKTARFDPALDHAGNPVPSYFAITIFYYTPRRNGPVSRGGTIAGGP